MTMTPRIHGGDTPMPQDRRGHWMQTVTGRRFYPLDPRSEDVDLQDIAHALAHICRFGGHVVGFYSVAQHSMLVSSAIGQASHGPAAQMHGLLHDAAEAYLGDVIWPLKQAPELAGYKQIEAAVEAVIFARFGVDPALHKDVVKHFDLVLLATEKRDLLLPGDGRQRGTTLEAQAARRETGRWHCDEVQPLPDRIRTPIQHKLSPSEVAGRFLASYNILATALGRPMEP